MEPGYRIATRNTKRLQVRQCQAGNAVAKSHPERAAIDVAQGDLAGSAALLGEQRRELAGQLAVVAFEVEFKIEAEAAGVPVGGAEERPDAIHDHDLRVVEGWRGQPNAAAA